MSPVDRTEGVVQARQHPTMEPPNSDSNLLYGILALQMDFISKDALIEAMSVWALEKNRGLDQILLERGQIARDSHALIEPLVRKHIRMHGDDASRSLASLAQADPLRRDLRELAGTRAIESLKRLSVAYEEGADPFETRPATVGVRTATGMRFRILRPHAKGGLGAIFVAMDEELDRQVALKEIQGRHADDPDSRARFLLEAEVTGKLEHPGIIPVYGLGTYPDGRPYYAMRLIRGESLEEAIERHYRLDPSRRSTGLSGRCPPRDLLERFLDVCDAIEYAHSRGVIHRDLKPANVMLGPYGETLVVDWGLAKTLGESAGSIDSQEGPVKTSSHLIPDEPAGTPIGTPHYMSPEQAVGEQDRLGPACDIYGLGATLYTLLTGRTPMQGANRTEIFRRVERGNFPTPRSVRPDVPRGLEAVCLKAMENKPSDRYGSPLELAEDLRRWLADEPVSVLRESNVARLGRWARRHRAWALAGVATLVVLLVTSMIFAAWSRRVADSEQTQREAAVIARNQAEASREQVVRLAARFAARSVANEVGLLLQILEQQAADPEGRELMQRAVGKPPGDPDREALQRWLQTQFQRYESVLLSAHWFVNDAEGNQIARVPFSENSMDENFAYRDYFHGQGRELNPAQAQALRAAGELGVIQAPYQSIVYRSVATDNPMAAFAAPIRASTLDGAEGEVIGVLSFAVEIGRFNVLRGSGGGDLAAVLIDTRPDANGRPGLILQHPWLSQYPTGQPVVYLGDEHLDQFERLRQAAGDDRDPSSRRSSLEGSLDRAYRDPIGVREPAWAGDWLAAFEPILVPRSADQIHDTHWVVIVQGRETP
ncbi:hypothetical protein BH23PLA1_BH23PLA1_15250 [soil metagenome]